MSLGFLIVVLLILIFVLPIIYFANRAAKKGHRYIGTEDPIQQYEDRVESNWAFPWGNIMGGGPGTPAGWRWRVRLQDRIDAKRARRRNHLDLSEGRIHEVRKSETDGPESTLAHHSEKR
jgi:hypothetical protein